MAVESKDLSRPEAYLRIAEVYHEADEADKALEWAEEGMWVFLDGRCASCESYGAYPYNSKLGCSSARRQR